MSHDIRSEIGKLGITVEQINEIDLELNRFLDREGITRDNIEERGRHLLEQGRDRVSQPSRADWIIDARNGLIALLEKAEKYENMLPEGVADTIKADFRRDLAEVLATYQIRRDLEYITSAQALAEIARQPRARTAEKSGYRILDEIDDVAAMTREAGFQVETDDIVLEMFRRTVSNILSFPAMARSRLIESRITGPQVFARPNLHGERGLFIANTMRAQGYARDTATAAYAVNASTVGLALGQGTSLGIAHRADATILLDDLALIYGKGSMRGAWLAQSIDIAARDLLTAEIYHLEGNLDMRYMPFGINTYRIDVARATRGATLSWHARRDAAPWLTGRDPLEITAIFGLQRYAETQHAHVDFLRTPQGARRHQVDTQSIDLILEAPLAGLSGNRMKLAILGGLGLDRHVIRIDADRDRIDREDAGERYMPRASLGLSLKDRQGFSLALQAHGGRGSDTSFGALSLRGRIDF